MEEFFTTLNKYAADFATSFGAKIIGALLVLIIGINIVKILNKHLSKKTFKHIDESVRKFMVSAIAFSLNLLVIITAALILGIPATTFVTVLGSAGLAIGLALQGSLSNLAGSIMILIFKAYKVGDFIEVSGVSGTVEEINLLYTVLVSPDNKRITIPNGNASNAVVIDYSVKELRRVDIEFGVAYGSDVNKVKEILLKVARENSNVLDDPQPFARLSRQDSSALTFVLRVWTKNADYWSVYFDIMEQEYAAMAENGIEIPYNQLDVHMK